MLRYSVAEVPCQHKIIRYLKAGKGTSYPQLLDLMHVLQRLDPTYIWVIMHGEHHINASLPPEEDALLLEYYQSPEFVAERLIWTKKVYPAE
jgi:hypothetical protein